MQVVGGGDDVMRGFVTGVRVGLAYEHRGDPEPEGHWIVMTDPEANEFRVCDGGCGC